MKKNLFLMFLIIVVIIILIFSGLALLKKEAFKLLPQTKLPTSSDILYITQPVTAVDGKVDKIEGHTFSVSHQYTLSDRLLTMNPTLSKTRDLTFQFTVTAKTKIFRPNAFVPYLFKKESPKPDEVLSLSDLKIGQLVAVTVNNDLRIASPNPFEATSIQITRTSNTIQGKISQASGNAFTLKATQKKQYAVRITSDTEISSSRSGPAAQISASQLTNGTQVTVYAAEDVAIDNQLTALRIDPITTQK